MSRILTAGWLPLALVVLAGSFWTPLANAQPFPVSDFDIETFLGLDPGTLDALSLDIGDDAAGFPSTEGSALQVSFFVEAGDVVTVDLNFLTTEATPEAVFNDFAFVSFIEEGLLTAVADTNSLGFVPTAQPGFLEETGVFTFTHVAESTGEITLAVGVLDATDTIVDSAVLVDNIQVDTVAGGFFFDFESGTFAGIETIGAATIVSTNIALDPIEGSFTAALSTGTPLPNAPASLIPEPGSLTLLLTGCAVLTRRRRTR